jgi:hypothetical protein
MTVKTFNDPTMFEPVVDPDQGGTSLGNSYLNAWIRCPRYWYNTYYRKFESATHTGQGLEPYQVGEPLLTGTLFHEGLDGYYKSGWRDGADSGEYKISEALTTAQAQWRSQKNRYADDTRADQDMLRVETMLTDYHQAYGPSGSFCDYPGIRICGDSDGNPLLEQDFRFELKKGYWYTGRLDGICLHQGDVRVLEHKTTSAYGVRNRLSSVSTDSQFTGEMWLAQQALPEVKVDGVLVNIVVKDRSPNSKYGVAVREPTTRTAAQIEQWRIGACSIIDHINDAVGEFEQSLKDGYSINVAEASCFPVHGTRNGNCYAYGRPCDFADLCSLIGMEGKVLNTFKTKNIQEKT